MKDKLKNNYEGKILLLSSYSFSNENARKISEDTGAYCICLDRLDDIRTLNSKDMKYLVKYIKKELKK